MNNDFKILAEAIYERAIVENPNLNEDYDNEDVGIYEYVKDDHFKWLEQLAGVYGLKNKNSDESPYFQKMCEVWDALIKEFEKIIARNKILNKRG